MDKWLCLLIVFLLSCSSAGKDAESSWNKPVPTVSITRDIYGIPHIYGKTDADAVFGLMYAQCEDNFEKVEETYLRILGKMSEKEGPSYYYQDIVMQALYDTTMAKKEWQTSPAWLKKLLTAFSDGIHYFLFKNPGIKPAVLTRFEPWFPLLFNDGAYISLNTGGLQQKDIQELFGKIPGTTFIQPQQPNDELTGSNGFAIAPKRSASGNALLFINPHVSFYFRTEVHVNSEEGLNAYGAATWGQFFIYHGFNEKLGWMHTSSLADAADLYEEKISSKDGNYFTQYDQELIPVETKNFIISYRQNDRKGSDSVKVQYTRHGPILGMRNGKPLSLKFRNHYSQGLIQSWQRMKCTSLEEFTSKLELKTNNSTNTMYADSKGNIAYWHGNFVPVRNAGPDYSQPQNGTTSATDWKGVHQISELVHVINPADGWIQNCNSSPFFVSGNSSPASKNYASYLAPESENFRSLRARTVFGKKEKWNADELSALAHDGYLSIFDSLLPPLFAAYENLPGTDPMKANLREPIMNLKSWDRRAQVNSVATTLAVFWAYNIISIAQKNNPSLNDIGLVQFAMNKIPSNELLLAMNGVVNGLDRLFNTWKVQWGDINRFQRTERSDHRFDDAKPSLPVAYASAFFGSLASYETVWGQGNKQYGVAGNSFVAVVEFGPKIKARSISTAGQSFDAGSKHFNDQTEMFLKGKLKDVFFYKEDVEKNKERSYKLSD